MSLTLWFAKHNFNPKKVQIDKPNGFTAYSFAFRFESQFRSYIFYFEVSVLLSVQVSPIRI